MKLETRPLLVCGSETVARVFVAVLGGLRDRKEDEERALHHRPGQRGERRGVQLQSSAARKRGVQHGAVRDQLVLHQLVQSGEWSR